MADWQPVSVPDRDPAQAWFWTPEWQVGQRESEGELAAGLGVTFDTAEDAIRWLCEPAEDEDA